MTTDRHKADIRIALSVGLIVFALVQGLAMATVQRIAPHVEQVLFDSAQTVAPNAPRGGINFDDSRNSGGIVNTLPVNSSARDEVKRQQPAPYCAPCVNGNPQPSLQPVRPATPVAPGTMVAKPTTPRYSIELFVLSDDRDSQDLLNWFNNDSTLQKWRKGTNFNVYTRDSPTYKTRFANKIPVTSFPVVLVTDPTGGDVYLCDRRSRPATVGQLTTAIAEKKRIQAETVARQRDEQLKRDIGQNIGQVSPSAKDSLLDAIVGADCVDGKCKPKPFWRSDHDHDSDSDPVQGLLRMVLRPGESIFQIVIILAAVVMIVFLVKRGRS